MAMTIVLLGLTRRCTGSLAPTRGRHRVAEIVAKSASAIYDRSVGGNVSHKPNSLRIASSVHELDDARALDNEHIVNEHHHEW